MKERIEALLINGYQPTEVVSVVGCTPSYISQLLKDTDFAARVQAGRIASAGEADEEIHLDKRYDKFEHKLLTSMEDGLAEASLGEKTRALEAIYKRKATKHAMKHPVPTGPVINNYVSLALPAQAVAQIKNMGPVVEINEQKEIIAIDNKPLAPMSSSGVKGLFAQIQERRAEDAKVLAEL